VRIVAADEEFVFAFVLVEVAWLAA